jgi:hypothetical protein
MDDVIRFALHEGDGKRRRSSRVAASERSSEPRAAGRRKANGDS